MKSDPIIDEVRAARQQILANVGNDLDALFDRLQVAQKEQDRKVETLPPRLLARPHGEAA